MKCPCCDKNAGDSLMLARHVVKADNGAHKRLKEWAKNYIQTFRRALGQSAKSGERLAKAFDKGWDDGN